MFTPKPRPPRPQTISAAERQLLKKLLEGRTSRLRGNERHVGYELRRRELIETVELDDGLYFRITANGRTALEANREKGHH